MTVIATESTQARHHAPAARGLISIPFLVLRATSTAGLIGTAILQIFVFARVLSPEQFSIFILVGTVGYSLWLIDLGVTKFLFVRIRADRLADRTDAILAKQSAAIVILYVLLTLASAVLCFLVLSAMPRISSFDAFGFALYFLFTSLNLTWYALRNISIAIDDYVYFEGIEVIRRFVSIGVMLLVLVGLPLLVFLLLANLLWAISLSIATCRLRRKNAISREWRGALGTLWPFYRDNKQDIIRSGTSATSDFYAEHLPYLIVPLAFGLGAPTIILDAIFKFVRGAALYYHAICDIVVPQQTSAIAGHDSRTLLRSTVLAIGLAVIPTAAVAGGLIFAGDIFFKLLLGPAATMPTNAIWVIIALLFGTMAQALSHSLLIHSGFFKEAARVMVFTAVIVTILPAFAFVVSPTVVGFLGFYAVAFGCGALLHVVLAVTGPFRAARGP
jgi:O-antigen/teichoic acid export membrane protein